jgi:hypothetical protein
MITRLPDFDQVTAIEIAAPSADWPAGSEGVGIRLKIDGTARSPDTALREGDQVSATRLDGLPTSSAVLTVRREFYLETGDLASERPSILIGSGPGLVYGFGRSPAQVSLLKNPIMEDAMGRRRGYRIHRR